MTDALMPHGLSYLSKLLNNNLYPSGLPSGSPSVASSAIPRRFRHVKSPLDEIMQSIPTGKSNDDEVTCRLPHVEIRYFQRPNSETGEKDEDCEEEMPNQELKDPKIVFSPKADMIKCDYTGALEESAGIWQEVAPYWDRLQLRFNQIRPYEVERRRAKPQCSIERPIERTNTPKILYTPIIDPLTRNAVMFSKQVPGYCGYLPRYPILPKPHELCRKPGFKSISRSTYKKFPSYDYQEFAHKGPLSSQVTTTAPFNPYNKLDLICLNGKRLLWKRPILQQTATKKRSRK